MTDVMGTPEEAPSNGARALQMRKRVAQGMRSQMGRMGAKDPVGISGRISRASLVSGGSGGQELRVGSFGYQVRTSCRLASNPADR